MDRGRLMIQKLYVNNFALIDDLEIEFASGLTALTGETGAGKTIILESLHLLFGKRSDQQMIRYGASKAIVEGQFRLNEALQKQLSLPETIVVRREVDGMGRHVMKINDEGVTLQTLREQMKAIGNLHQQNDTLSLMDRQSYLSFLDQSDESKITPLLNTYLIKRSQYLEKKQAFNQLTQKKEASLEKQAFLEYQVTEIKNYQLNKGEKEALEEELNKLKHYDQIMNQLQAAYYALSSETNPLDDIYLAGTYLEKIQTIDKTYQDMMEQLKSSFYEIDDVKSKIFHIIETLDFDQERFNHMQERHYDLIKIEQKYQKTIDEVIAYYEEIKAELLMITDYDAYLKEAQDNVEALFNDCYDAGIRLSKQREKLARILEKSLLQELKDLDLPNAQFNIEFITPEKKPSSLLETGIDQIEFMISLNEGEPLKPLARVASGGERARFMFALKAVYARHEQLSMLVLDEIDIGVSGKTAAKVAQKMVELAQTMQLIVITHLPQVAAKADHHFGITKVKEQERMVTQIKTLSQAERIETIGLMLSDEKLSHHAIEQAKMLLKK